MRIHSSSTESLQQLKTGTAPIVSQAVCSMVEQIRLFHATKLTPDFCLMHMEECMAELYNKSCALTEFIDDQAEVVNTFQLANAINCDISDLPLLISVASLHSPTMLGSLDVWKSSFVFFCFFVSLFFFSVFLFFFLLFVRNSKKKFFLTISK